ncbi:DUF4097 family beta strand repeat-containing protein [Streptomyces sp. NPDC050504]|uniref:DUF4097 family beta strand repeat-containing protein n=1 Tax=Streptomyces sp. NPDC050504 TaxID=3365618 RepID=UPI00379787BD
MSLRTRTLLASGGAVVAALALTGCGGANLDDAPVEHKSFAFSGKSLTIDADNSELKLVPADVKAVEVTRQYDGWVLVGDGPEASWKLEGDKLTLRVKCSGVAANCDSRHEVKVPRGIAVTVDNDNGSVNASGFATPLKVRSDNGSVTVSDSSGALDLGSSNGSVTAKNVTSKSVDADSDNGEVKLSLASVPNRIDVRSDNGSVVIDLPNTPTSYKVTARSDNGDTRIDVPKSDSSRHTVKAVSDNGEVTVRTAN